MNSNIYYANDAEELRIIVKSDIKECDVLASIISSWHLVNLVALIEMKSLKNVFCIIYPEILSDGNPKFRLTEKMLVEYLFYFKRIIFFRLTKTMYNISNSLFVLKKREKSTIYINPGLRPNLKFLFILSIKPTFFYAIDEGLGTYLSVSDFKKSLSIANKSNRYVDYLKELAIFFLNGILFKKKSTYYLFHKQNGKQFILNKLVCNSLYRVYNRLDEVNICQTKNSVFILMDYRVVESKYLLNLFEEIAVVLQNVDEVIIKRHPNDMDTSLKILLLKFKNIIFIESEKSAEELVAEYKPQFIIGGYTTSLFSCSAIFNIEAISYMGLYNKIPISDICRNEITFFIEGLKQNQLLHFPNSKVEFLRILKCLLYER